MQIIQLISRWQKSIQSSAMPKRSTPLVQTLVSMIASSSNERLPSLFTSKSLNADSNSLSLMSGRLLTMSVNVARVTRPRGRLRLCKIVQMLPSLISFTLHDAFEYTTIFHASVTPISEQIICKLSYPFPCPRVT